MEENAPPNEILQVPNQEVEAGEVEPLHNELTMEFASLGEVKVLLFREMQDKKIIFSCPMALYKCSLDIRPPQDLIIGKHAITTRLVILSPSMSFNSLRL